MQRILVFSGLIVFLWGCASTLTTLKPNSDYVLEPNHGLVLIAVNSNIELGEIVIGGTKRVALEEETFQGRQFFLASVPAGKYRFRKIVLRKSESAPVTSLRRAPAFKIPKKDKLDWNFEVLAGSINYVGELRVKQKFRILFLSLLDFVFAAKTAIANIDIVNRSSTAYVHMKENHPTLLTKYPLKYGGFGKDNFFSKVSKLEKYAALPSGDSK